MKIKNNALALYMQSEEVMESIISKNLNLKDEINEKINFLKNLSGKDIIIKGYDEKNFFCSQYENSKKYTFSISLLDEENKEEEKEEEKDLEEEEKEILKNFFNRQKISVFIIGILFFSGFLFFGINKNKIEANKEIKSDFIILTEKVNKNNFLIAKQLQFQKELRNQINNSIKEVKKIEKQNLKIRADLILLSNN